MDVYDLIEQFLTETTALLHALDGNYDKVRVTILRLEIDQLDKFSDELDELAVIVDGEQVRRRTIPGYGVRS